MIGQFWLGGALVVSGMFLAGVSYKAYHDVQTAKNIQENYKIISDIKELLAKHYHTTPDNITRDQIIAHLPSGGSWEKVLIIDRNRGDITNDSLIDEDGRFVLSEDEKVKLFALRAKLSNLDVVTQETDDGKVTFSVGKDRLNIGYQDEIIKNQLKKTIEILDINKQTLTSADFDNMIDTYTPYSSIYQDLRLEGESDEDYEANLQDRKKEYFSNLIKTTLQKSQNIKDITLYDVIKDM